MSGIRDGYPTVSEWLPGDRVSAAKLNNQLDLIDAAIGMDEQRVYPFDAGANLTQCVGLPGRPFEGSVLGDHVDYWLAHNGDQLVISLAGTAPAHFWWRNNEYQTPDATLAANTVHTINLAQTQRGIADLYQYQPCSITLRSVNHPDDTLYVRYIYQRDSSAPATLGSLPSFTNGGASVAEDLNTIRNATDLALDVLGQPIPCQYSNDDRVGSRNFWQGYIRHTHSKLTFDITVRVSGWDTGDFCHVQYNGVQVWAWNPTASSFSFSGPVTVDVPAGLTVGTWYPLQVGFTRSAEHEQYVNVWSMAEVPGDAFSTLDALPRWEHGDVLNGSAGGPPNLAQMTTALTGVSANLRWINQPCRTAGTQIANVGVLNCNGDQTVDSMSSVRVHRWLVYNALQLANGTWTRPQIQWFTNGRAMGSYSLPQVEAASFFDLESTPVKPGMWFKISGVQFAIQTAQAGSNYA